MIEMNAPAGPNVLDHDVKDGIVGKPIDRIDGPLKVTGTAKYAAELPDAGKTAYGFVVTASIGHGTITAIDAGAALRSAGVIKVLTHEDAPQQIAGDHRENLRRAERNSRGALWPASRPRRGGDVRASAAPAPTW